MSRLTGRPDTVALPLRQVFAELRTDLDRINWPHTSRLITGWHCAATYDARQR